MDHLGLYWYTCMVIRDGTNLVTHLIQRYAGSLQLLVTRQPIFSCQHGNHGYQTHETYPRYRFKQSYQIIRGHIENYSHNVNVINVNPPDYTKILQTYTCCERRGSVNRHQLCYQDLPLFTSVNGDHMDQHKLLLLYKHTARFMFNSSVLHACYVDLYRVSLIHMLCCLKCWFIECRQHLFIYVCDLHNKEGLVLRPVQWLGPNELIIIDPHHKAL